MAEQPLDLRGLPKRQAYGELESRCQSVLEGIADSVAGMATMSCLLHHGFGHLWTGFYRVVTPGALLRVGPYQGTLGCLEIAFGAGVCGTAAAQGQTIIVPDVTEFPGHVACDPNSRSEIVVPVFDARGELHAVLDVDSVNPGVFNAEDALGLEVLVRWFARSDVTA